MSESTNERSIYKGALTREHLTTLLENLAADVATCVYERKRDDWDSSQEHFQRNFSKKVNDVKVSVTLKVKESGSIVDELKRSSAGRYTYLRLTPKELADGEQICPEAERIAVIVVKSLHQPTGKSAELRISVEEISEPPLVTTFSATAKCAEGEKIESKSEQLPVRGVSSGSDGPSKGEPAA